MGTRHAHDQERATAEGSAMSTQVQQFVLEHEPLDGGTEWEEKTFTDVSTFWSTVDIIKEKGLDYEYDTPEDYEVPGEKQDEQESDSEESVEAEIINETEPEPKTDGNGEVPDQVEPQSTETAVVETGTGRFPEISDIEGKVRSIINSLDSADMNRLVWNPDAKPGTVPYDPTYLPYDSPEPSAEAFDMFATVIEQTQGIQYSVVDVEFSQNEETIGCTVVIEKQSEKGSKRLVGVKTRKLSKTQGLDHWRERLYSKARRNALKQDIPPTWVSTLIDRFNTMQVNQ